MPIKGLTTRAAAAPRLTRIGKLRKGKFENGKPVDLDYFRYVPQRGYEDAARAFFDAYGPEPRQINVILPHRTMEENWITWREEWGKGKGLIHRCDGEYMVQWLKDDMTYALDYDQAQRKPCPGGCQPVGRLSVVIQELFVIGFAGYVTLELSSVNDLASITSALLDLESKFAHARNGLMGLQCVLRRNLDEIGVRYADKRGGYYKGRSSKWMVHLDLSPEFAARQIEIAQHQALSRSYEALPAPVIDAEAVELDEPLLEEGHETEPEPKLEPGDGHKFARPYDPETLRAKIAARVQAHAGDSYGDRSENFRFAVIANLESCFGQHQDQGRHLVTEWLLGQASSKELTDPEIMALQDWLKPCKEDDKWVVNELALQEAHAVHKQALKDKGQTTLFDDSDLI